MDASTLPPVAGSGFALNFKHRNYDDVRLRNIELPRSVSFTARLRVASVVLNPDSPSRDVMLMPEDVLIEWSDRPGLAGDRVVFPFEVTHQGPFVLSARSTIYVCGTYETYGVYINNVDRNEFVSGLSPCVVGIVSSTSGFLDRGRYEFVAGHNSVLAAPRDRPASPTRADAKHQGPLESERPLIFRRGLKAPPYKTRNCKPATGD